MSNGHFGLSRVTRSKAEAKTSYNRLSRWYDVLAGNSERNLTDIGLQKLRVQQGERVLEIGYGTGHGIAALAQAVGNAGRVYGLDISHGMLNIAQARVRNAGLSERVELHCGDAAQLPFATGSLDAVFMSFTLELFDTPEIPIVLRQCHGVLRPAGRICVVGMSRVGNLSLSLKLYEWLHRKLPKYIDCRPIFVRQALEAAGFRALDATQVALWGLPVEIVTAGKPS